MTWVIVLLLAVLIYLFFLAADTIIELLTEIRDLLQQVRALNDPSGVYKEQQAMPTRRT